MHKFSTARSVAGPESNLFPAQNPKEQHSMMFNNMGNSGDLSFRSTRSIMSVDRAFNKL